METTKESRIRIIQIPSIVLMLYTFSPHQNTRADAISTPNLQWRELSFREARWFSQDNLTSCSTAMTPVQTLPPTPWVPSLRISLCGLGQCPCPAKGSAMFCEIKELEEMTSKTQPH